MESFAEKRNTGGVKIHTVDANGGIASGVAKKLNALVGVGKNATSVRTLNGQHCHRGNCQF